ncbi:MAG: hypothetical protein K5925_03025 [Bacilli bacterium]|nr:hypothetical protein [Bacilli bacterium]
MKKLLTVLAISLPLILSSCGCHQRSEERERKDPDPIDQEPTPTEKSASTLTEEEHKDFPNLCINKLASYASYQASTDGSTDATVFGITTTQSIKVLSIKSDYSYVKNESHSDLVNTVHTAYFHDGKAVYSDGGDFKTSTLTDYLKVYGTYLLDRAIEGYTIDEKSITNVEKVESEQDYAFKITFDPVEATNNVKIQMAKFGGLDDYPSFSKVELVITVKDDFTPVSIKLDAYYSAIKTMIIQVTTDCHQHYTVDFSKYNETIGIPGLDDSIKQKFTATEVNPKLDTSNKKGQKIGIN